MNSFTYISVQLGRYRNQNVKGAENEDDTLFAIVVWAAIIIIAAFY